MSQSERKANFRGKTRVQIVIGFGFASYTNVDGFQSRDETAILVHKTVANYGPCFAL